MLPCGQDGTRPASLGDTPFVGGFANIRQEVVILAQLNKQQLGLNQGSMKGCPNGRVLREGQTTARRIRRHAVNRQSFSEAGSSLLQPAR